MNVSLPLADLVGSTTARLLHRLALVAEPTSGRRLSRLAGVPVQSGARALAELAAIGLVDRREVGRALLYRLNRAHVLWGPVESLLDAPLLVEERIGEIVRELAEEGTTAAVFGSFARRDGSRGSDIDIAIVWEDATDGHVRDELPFALRTAIGELTGNTVDVIALDDSTLRAMASAGDPFLESLLRDSVTVAGPELSARVRQVAA